ncbi:MAG: flavodoxin family protein [Armatimonadota bacterium]|jgi:multimeric flavodoxin WrbA
MRVIAVQGSPNVDGLTSTGAQRALDGAAAAGAHVELIHLRNADIRLCLACDEGWGKCREEGVCVIEDDLEPTRQKLYAADALVVSTPVYFGETSEIVKAFLDRLRRCERGAKERSPLPGTPVLGIAAAGGSGRGTVSCAQMLERCFSHTGMRLLDILPLTRWNRDYMLPALEGAGRRLVALAEE